MDYFVLTVASLILFAATFFSTVTGFGFALIAAPVLTMVMGPKETVSCICYYRRCYCAGDHDVAYLGRI